MYLVQELINSILLYLLITLKIGGPAFAMRGRNIIRKIYNTPGPARYSPNSSAVKNNTTYAYSFGNRYDYQSKSKQSTPGPANYNSDKIDFITKKNPSPVFGNEKRQEMIIRCMVKNPGPGNYKLNLKFTQKQSPHYR